MQSSEFVQSSVELSGIMLLTLVEQLPNASLLFLSISSINILSCICCSKAFLSTPIKRCLLLNIRACLSFSNRRLRSMAACSFRSIGKSSLYIPMKNSEPLGLVMELKGYQEI
ncbi:hypothetical protein BpHYR1_045406 [Brachionus plicatilis]|uniref:Uncharacterized protein n=1 Tax=Brachionus plicatilis TaxID=10195 RepID=A0A3M7SLK9_BRAPC|nr:hypothetical protein BpHYR1_045406 [Brachionus plicatilis]